ncbi:molybdenum cofactor biosynthesis protein MoaC [candidate division KD3-62 bacterium DG_56]|uniref:Molybdenum cofactor biosynthesis protein MoaC n=1 Tax=candidate division KD3-62 bacterium DG_56 TaxID=1704032 RepID=A0A0S7XLP4_9BACT|nr:MAG: molybdenum cofactor biosynthesis protein MoaC [candidate division KD3-62 bacterium DG_56]
MRKRDQRAAAPVTMVDVGAKRVTRRQAVARGRVVLGDRARRLLAAGELPKGDAIQAARVTGIMAAKSASSLIPLCHNIALDGIEVEVTPTAEGVEIEARVRARARTGVEMEALAATAAAALTVYDMCKAVDRAAVISDIRLIEKSGGRSGRYRR